MILIEKMKAFNFEGAVYGMRNPLNSWSKIDSDFSSEVPLIGKNDLDLMRRLYNAGPEHAKYLRQIFVSFDIVAPLYLYKELDTYKVGTTSNSCSTMHKIHTKEFTVDDFSHEHLSQLSMMLLKDTVNLLNFYRERYNKLTDADSKKECWWQMIQLLPSSYNQRRTMTMSYANVMSIINQREHHKLDEWHIFCDALRELPYVKEIRGEK